MAAGAGAQQGGRGGASRTIQCAVTGGGHSFGAGPDGARCSVGLESESSYAYMLTAGHCLDDMDSVAPVYQRTVIVGHQSNWTHGGTQDLRLIRMTSRSRAGRYVRHGPTSLPGEASVSRHSRRGHRPRMGQQVLRPVVLGLFAALFLGCSPGASTRDTDVPLTSSPSPEVNCVGMDFGDAHFTVEGTGDQAVAWVVVEELPDRRYRLVDTGRYRLVLGDPAHIENASGEVVAVEDEPVAMFGDIDHDQKAWICDIGEDTLPLP